MCAHTHSPTHQSENAKVVTNVWLEHAIKYFVLQRTRNVWTRCYRDVYFASRYFVSNEYKLKPNHTNQYYVTIELSIRLSNMSYTHPHCYVEEKAHFNIHCCEFSLLSDGNVPNTHSNLNI